MVIRLGMIGLSPGNGHPYSFSAIINGFDDEPMSRSGWDGIYGYLKRRDTTEIGIDGAKVTHVWTQDASLTRQVAASCKIASPVENPEDMLGEVDALVIARDDWQTHAPIARPFLEAGVSVFIDKPLTLSPDELAEFLPHFEAGRLMSCSGLRYAGELDVYRASPETQIGQLKAVHCGVVKGWETYGIHMLDAVFGCHDELEPVSVEHLGQSSDSYVVHTSQDVPLVISCLGDNAPVFRLTFLGDRGQHSVTISDNFTAFKRTMSHFINMVRTGNAPFETRVLKRSIHTLMAGAISADSGAKSQITSYL